MFREYFQGSRVRTSTRCRLALTALLIVGVSASARGQTVNLITGTDWNGSPSTGHSDFMSFRALSEVGRQVVFGSDALLVQADNNGVRDVYVYDQNTSTFVLVSIDSSGTPGNMASAAMTNGGGAAISRYGRFVIFTSAATNLAGTDNNNQVDIFVHDRDFDGNLVFDQTFAGARGTVRVSVNSSGTEATGGFSQRPVISSDGRHAAFTSTATNLVANDTNNTADIFVHDRDADCDGVFDQAGAIATVRVNLTPTGGQAMGGASARPSISDNGRFVVFDSTSAQLITGGDLNGVWDDVFVFDRDADADGRFDETGAGETATILISQSSAGVQGNAHSNVSAGGAISASGRWVVFYSRSSNLVASPGNNPDIYVRDRDLDGNGVFDEAFAGATATVLVGVDANGNTGNAGSLGASISADGRYVMFGSAATNLDVNTTGAIGMLFSYLHDRDADGNGIYDETFAGARSTTMVSMTQTVVQPPGARQSAIALSPDGGYVGVSSLLSLAPADTNNFHDAYVIDMQPDSDGDGLLDTWETNGVDADGDGNIDLVLPNADPNRKTVYVEIDGMTGRVPTQATLNGVVTAFANAPVRNPDGTTGIDLVLLFDETNETLTQWAFSWTPFANFKAARFGTAAERASANSVNILTAKDWTYRYCVFADRFITNTVSGLAEAPGDDFFITLGGWTPAGGTVAQQQGLFMHELGHGLGLGHGGVFQDPVNGPTNYKPNHLSVMNYTWTVPALVATNPNQGTYWQFWTLDFSGANWPCLDETCLNEPVGIGGRPFALVPVGPIVTGAQGQQWGVLERERGAVDFGRNGNTTQTCVAANINQLPGNNGSPTGELLAGHDDWGNLWYAQRGSLNFGPATTGFADPGQEITFEQVEALAAIGDCNANGTWDRDEIAAGTSLDLNGNLIPDECEGGCDAPWDEDFDGYPSGTQLHGVSGWKGWDDDPAFSAPITQVQSLSPTQSVDISGAADLVRQDCTNGDGLWSVEAWQYIPANFTSGGGGQFAGHYFNLLNIYNEGGPYHWSVQVQFDSTDGKLKAFHGNGTNTIDVLYETDRWVKIHILIDLETDWLQFYYDDTLITEYTWTGGVLGGGGGALDIAAVDLYAQGSSSIYYDDLDVLKGCGSSLSDDSDGDGLSTATEFLLGTDSCNPDTDGDGWLDGADNCPLTPNPGQEDCDGDGVGDACMLEFGLSHDCNGNGVPDECDPEALDIGLFVALLLDPSLDPILACMLDHNNDGDLNGKDTQKFIARLIGN